MKDFRKADPLEEDIIDIPADLAAPPKWEDEEVVEREEAVTPLPARTEREMSVKAAMREDRIAKVWEMKLRGVSTFNIASALNVSRDTIYSDLKMLGKRFREDILHTDPLTMVAENVQWLEELERVALFEVARSNNVKTSQEVITQKGEVVKVEVDSPDSGAKSRFYQAALKAREMRLDILFKTGVIPKNPEELFKGLERFQEKTTDIEATAERSDADIKESIDNLLKYGNKL